MALPRLVNSLHNTVANVTQPCCGPAPHDICAGTLKLPAIALLKRVAMILMTLQRNACFRLGRMAQQALLTHLTQTTTTAAPLAMISVKVDALLPGDTARPPVA
jgi:hypothetical protein